MSNKRYPHLMFSEKIVSLHSKARSFDIMQNKAEYRTSLVSKSLPIAKRLSAIYSFPIAKTIRCVSQGEMLHALISQLVQPICVKLHYFSPVRPIRQTPFPFLVHFLCLADVLWLPNRVEAIWLLSSSSE